LIWNAVEQDRNGFAARELQQGMGMKVPLTGERGRRGWRQYPEGVS